MPRIDKRKAVRRHDNCPIGLGYQPRQQKFAESEDMVSRHHMVTHETACRCQS